MLNESVEDFSFRARTALANAISASGAGDGARARLDTAMLEAKRRHMTFVEGLEFSIDHLKRENATHAKDSSNEPGGSGCVIGG